jgi:titin
MWLTFHRFLRALSETNSRKASRRPRTSALRPRLEALEDRTLLSPYMVTTTADSGAGSLRDAITQINADTSHKLYTSPTNPLVDEIDFNIPTTDLGYDPNTGAFTIKPQSGLPTITNAVILDGYTQPGASPNTLAQGDNAVLEIQLDLSVPAGPNVGVSAGNSTIRGLVLNGVQGGNPAIVVSGTGDHIEGNFIGTDVTGSKIAGNAGLGIDLEGSNDVVGGTTPDTRNILSGNGNSSVQSFRQGGIFAGSGNSVQGNYIGTDLTGTIALGNGNSSVFVAGVGAGNNTTIGGTAPGAGNLISGNQIGINTSGSSGEVIQGNLIGTDVTGTSALANATGIWVGSAAPTTIGGNSITNPAARNIISGNVIGIRDESGSSLPLIEGNYIGTDITGTQALGNVDGVWLESNETLGGTAAGDGNVISGNTTIGVRVFGNANQIEGNLIGTDYTGANAIGNTIGIYMGDGGNNNVIGGLVAGARNVISGNAAGSQPPTGIDLLSGSGNMIEGNYIGTDISGAAPLGNGRGIAVTSSNNVIGGTATGAGNVISGNQSDGIDLLTGSGNLIEGNYIGTDRRGTVALGNVVGVAVERSAGANTIGGTAKGAGNVISGNQNDGVLVVVSGVTLQGNYIGTDVTGTQALGNGVRVDLAGSGHIVGGTGAGNVISGNFGDGLDLSGSGIQVLGNWIGTDQTGTQALGNGGDGVRVTGFNNAIGGKATGAGNVIAFNGSDGVRVNTGTGNFIRENSIHDSGNLGIELVNNGNRNQPAPVLTSAVTTSSSIAIQGTLTAAASTIYYLDFFASPAANPSGFGEGQQFLGTATVTTDGSGTKSFSVSLAVVVPAGWVVSATATDPVGNTSAFAQDVTAGPGVTPAVPSGAAGRSAAPGSSDALAATWDAAPTYVPAPPSTPVAFAAAPAGAVQRVGGASVDWLFALGGDPAAVSVLLRRRTPSADAGPDGDYRPDGTVDPSAG